MVSLFSKRPLSRNEQHEPHAVLFRARLHHPQPRFAEVPSFQEHGAAQSAFLKRVDHLPGFSALASDGVEEKECFSELVHLQREGLGAFETVFRKGQGRGKRLVTEDSKPVGSGLIIYSSFSYYKKLCSFASTSPACAGSRVSARSHTPFSETLLIRPLPPNSARMGFQFVLDLPPV